MDGVSDAGRVSARGSADPVLPNFLQIHVEDGPTPLGGNGHNRVLLGARASDFNGETDAEEAGQLGSARRAHVENACPGARI